MSATPAGIQLSRRSGWRLRKVSPNAVNVARPTIWGNPWKTDQFFLIGLDGEYTAFLTSEGAALAAVERYEKWLLTGHFMERFVISDDHLSAIDERRSEMIDRLSQLRGRDLACWCGLDSPCHRNVLITLANGARPGFM